MQWTGSPAAGYIGGHRRPMWRVPTRSVCRSPMRVARPPTAHQSRSTADRPSSRRTRVPGFRRDELISNTPTSASQGSAIEAGFQWVRNILLTRIRIVCWYSTYRLHEAYCTKHVVHSPGSAVRANGRRHASRVSSKVQISDYAAIDSQTRTRQKIPIAERRRRKCSGMNTIGRFQACHNPQKKLDLKAKETAVDPECTKQSFTH